MKVRTLVFMRYPDAEGLAKIRAVGGRQNLSLAERARIYHRAPAGTVVDNFPEEQLAEHIAAGNLEPAAGDTTAELLEGLLEVGREHMSEDVALAVEARIAELRAEEEAGAAVHGSVGPEDGRSVDSREASEGAIAWILEGTVADAASEIAEIDNLADLAELAELEAAGGGRKGVKKAIESRRAELESAEG